MLTHPTAPFVVGGVPSLASGPRHRARGKSLYTAHPRHRKGASGAHPAAGTSECFLLETLATRRSPDSTPCQHLLPPPSPHSPLVTSSRSPPPSEGTTLAQRKGIRPWSITPQSPEKEEQQKTPPGLLGVREGKESEFCPLELQGHWKETEVVGTQDYLSWSSGAETLKLGNISGSEAGGQTFLLLKCQTRVALLFTLLDNFISIKVITSH